MLQQSIVEGFELCVLIIWIEHCFSCNYTESQLADYPI